jgi:sulfite exporter TauE/SafE
MIEKRRRTMRIQLTLRTIAYIVLIVIGLLMASANEMTWISARFILDPVHEASAVIFPF